MSGRDILDAARSRPFDGGPSFTLRNRLQRGAWNVVWLLLASWTPRAFHPWRRTLLRAFGARVSPRSDVRGSARVWMPSNLTLGRGAVLAERVNCYNMAEVSIGEYVIVSQGAHLCAGNHDIDSEEMQLIARPITLGDRSWVAAEAFVAPGVTLGEGAVLGARAAAFSRLEPWTLYIGNPAMPRRARRRPAGSREAAR